MTASRPTVPDSPLGHLRPNAPPSNPCAHFLPQSLETLKKKGCKPTPLNQDASQILANASVLTVSQGAERDGHGPQREASAQKDSSQMAFLDQQCPKDTNAKIWGPRPSVLPGSQCLPSLVDIRSTVTACGHGVFEGSLSALELAQPLEAQKRKHESLGTRKRKRKKRH